jgi:hypothetical protein
MSDAMIKAVMLHNAMTFLFICISPRVMVVFGFVNMCLSLENAYTLAAVSTSFSDKLKF